MISKLCVGMAEVDFTPPPGLPLMGNFRNDYAAHGVHDPLMARAVVFADAEGAKVAMAALDLCMITRKQAAWMRNDIARRCDLPSQNILIAATHTHSGPATRKLYSAPSASTEDIEAFLGKAAEAVIAANADLRPASLRFGTADEGRVSFCRRLHCGDGKIHMNWERLPANFIIGPAGKIDPEVRVLSIDSDGAEVGMLVNFSLHPAIIGFADNRYSADYPGVLAAALQKTHASRFHTAFFTACCGDINHIDPLRPPTAGEEYAVVERVGTLLAQAATLAASRGRPMTGTPILVSSEFVALKRLPIDEKTYQWAVETCKRLEKQQTVGDIDGLADELSASTWVEMYECQHEEDQVEVMAIRLGDLAIVGFPGEMFSDFQKRLKAESPAPYTLCIELANDSIGYLPAQEAFATGGYEVMPGATLYQKDAGERLVASALRQLQKLFSL